MRKNHSRPYMKSTSQPLTASIVTLGITGMVMSLVGVPLSNIPQTFSPDGGLFGMPFSSFGSLLLFGAVFVLLRAMDSLADSKAHFLAKITGSLLIVVGGWLLLAVMSGVSSGGNSEPPHYSWRMIAFSCLTSLLLTCGIHLRGNLPRSQASRIFAYWLLYVPLTFVVVRVYPLIGVNLGATIKSIP